MKLNRPTRSDMIDWLRSADQPESRDLFAAARQVKHSIFGNKVYTRALIEFGNICTKNCFYCGIRRENRQVKRYMMSREEILRLARWAREKGFASVVLQGGEKRDERHTRFVEDVVRSIKQETGQGITLSLGEQEPETYERWFEAGAHRYLLRIETSNPFLYAALHPLDHSFEQRVTCLRTLKEIGYQVGTGVMIGLPGQSDEDLAEDILFFECLDADMIGMGPYVPHRNTPLVDKIGPFDPARQLQKSLVMIALTRLRLRDVNIAATTALAALHPKGRTFGVLAGANVVMPGITPSEYRIHYDLYEGRPREDEDLEGEGSDSLERELAQIGEVMVRAEYGDSPHYFRRISGQCRTIQPDGFPFDVSVRPRTSG